MHSRLSLPIALAAVATLTVAACKPSTPAASPEPNKVSPPAASTGVSAPPAAANSNGTVAKVTLAAGTLDATSEPTTACSIDAIDQQKVSDTPAAFGISAPHRIRGWIANETAKNGIASFNLVLKNESASYLAASSATFARPDVNEYLKVPNMEVQPGFEVDLDASGVSPGTYDIVLYYKGMANKPYFCNTGRKVIVGS